MAEEKSTEIIEHEAKPKYYAGIVFGVVAIVSILAFVAVPFGMKWDLLVCFIIYIAAGITSLVTGLVCKNDKLASLVTVIAFGVSAVVITLVELNNADCRMINFGWLFGLLTAISGLVRTLRNRKEYAVRLAVFLNVLSFILVFVSFVTCVSAFHGMTNY